MVLLLGLSTTDRNSRIMLLDLETSNEKQGNGRTVFLDPSVPARNLVATFSTATAKAGFLGKLKTAKTIQGKQDSVNIPVAWNNCQATRNLFTNHQMTAYTKT